MRVVRIYQFDTNFEISSARRPADLQWPTGGGPLADRGSQVTGRGGRAVSELSMETPDEDAAEQAQEVPEKGEEELSELPLEVDEADAAEQIRDAGYDDEDYR